MNPPEMVTIPVSALPHLSSMFTTLAIAVSGTLAIIAIVFLITRRGGRFNAHHVVDGDRSETGISISGAAQSGAPREVPLPALRALDSPPAEVTARTSDAERERDRRRDVHDAERDGDAHHVDDGSTQPEVSVRRARAS